VSEVLVRKWVEDAYVEGYSPQLRVFVELVNVGRVGVEVEADDEYPVQATPVEANGFVPTGPGRLQARLRLEPGRSELLSYTLEFASSFNGYLPSARARAGRLEFRTREVRAHVKVLPAPAIAQPGAVVQPGGGVQLGPPAQLRAEPSFGEIPFHEEVKKQLMSSVDDGFSVLLYGPDVCTGRLVRAAARYARGKGFRVVYAIDLAYAPPGSQSFDSHTFVAAPDFDELVANLLWSAAWPPFLSSFKEAVESGAIVVASMSVRDWSEFESRLRELRAASSAFAEYLQSVFNVKIRVEHPSLEEVKGYVAREAGECIDGEAKNLDWLSSFASNRRKPLTCRDAECLVKCLKAAYRVKGSPLSSNECAAAVGAALTQEGSGRRWGSGV
jgi:hypothetical protein